MPSAAPPTAGEPSKPRASPLPKDDPLRERILVCGWRKAGKSSCIKTVFQGVPTKDVPYFGVTQKIEKINYDTIIPLQIWDTPTNFELDQLDVPLGSFSTIVYVMDMQQEDMYPEIIARFVQIVVRAHFANPNMKFAIFIHKAEAMAQDYREDNYRQIQQTAEDELLDFPFHTIQNLAPSLNFSDPSVTNALANDLVGSIRYRITSAYEANLREAWSGVVQGVMEMLPSVEQLLLNFTANCGMDNSFLFDIASRVIVAADNRGKNDETLDQVTDYLSRFMQFRELYKNLHLEVDENGPNSADGDEEDKEEEEEEEEYEPEGWWDEEDPEIPWMTQATRLTPNTTLALWQFTPHLALVVLLRTATWEATRGMIEYNLTFLRQGVRRILMEV
ncbi:Gtr1/RagA G protein conserved region-domain-containing protein [Naematelia encephala]|uniref:GTP-binding protein n=1 Tax=Naematelia encephala TaxID=71784 RepID=A0A1Y2AQE1_9TREE|nr:Gtr1/RagA G protein conserved region-domain-containing protein [Naematelia encephala]